MTANKSSENFTFRNTLLCVVVSKTSVLSERFISRTMETSRHSIRKALMRRSRADEGENIWGGLP